jgi:electron transport complex protein RnfD
MNFFTVSASPHIRTRESTSRIMLDVVIALIPAGIASIWFFGVKTLWIILLGTTAAVLTELLIQKLMKKPVTIGDCSAVVTGILLAYNLPPSAPWWLPVIGSIIAVALVKQAFGGLGHNFMNPALAARAILMASWPVRMTYWNKLINIIQHGCSGHVIGFCSLNLYWLFCNHMCQGQGKSCHCSYKQQLKSHF